MATETNKHNLKGLQTEYSDNFNWQNAPGQETTLAHEEDTENAYKYAEQRLNLQDDLRRPNQHSIWSQQPTMSRTRPDIIQRDPNCFHSSFYPSIYRETVIRKDERGHYIDPFKNIATKPYGRKLMYDTTHPDKMYSSQWSSELADHPGPYSFPTTTGFPPQHPWRKDLQWREHAEIGEWPTPLWKDWTKVAICPPYDGHDDQVEYSKYKVQMPWNHRYK
jgi:hypothetical protein